MRKDLRVFQVFLPTTCSILQVSNPHLQRPVWSARLVNDTAQWEGKVNIHCMLMSVVWLATSIILVQKWSQKQSHNLSCPPLIPQTPLVLMHTLLTWPLQIWWLRPCQSYFIATIWHLTVLNAATIMLQLFVTNWVWVGDNGRADPGPPLFHL